MYLTGAAKDFMCVLAHILTEATGWSIDNYLDNWEVIDNSQNTYRDEDEMKTVISSFSRNLYVGGKEREIGIDLFDGCFGTIATVSINVRPSDTFECMKLKVKNGGFKGIDEYDYSYGNVGKLENNARLWWIKGFKQVRITIAPKKSTCLL
ncbi:hypothetical protein BX667DRAFT_500206 [Coemansia mojavensis]|nr:hypothetical protein BX667DRAFT_500206 [Coemansia mojavensis]